LAAQFSLGAQHGAGWTVCEQRFDEVHDGERMADLGKHEMGRVDIDISYARPGSGKPKHGAFAPEGAVVADERKLFELANPAICGPLADGTTIAGEETASNLGGGDDAVPPDPGEDGDIAVGDTGAGTARRGSRGPRRQPSLCRSQKGETGNRKVPRCHQNALNHDAVAAFGPLQDWWEKRLI
jgi:hypothetical protein